MATLEAGEVVASKASNRAVEAPANLGPEITTAGAVSRADSNAAESARPDQEEILRIVPCSLVDLWTPTSVRYRSAKTGRFPSESITLNTVSSTSRSLVEIREDATYAARAQTHHGQDSKRFLVA